MVWVALVVLGVWLGLCWWVWFAACFFGWLCGLFLFVFAICFGFLHFVFLISIVLFTLNCDCFGFI